MHENTRKLISNIPDLTHSNNFKPLWWDDWYDGELSGLCEWNNRLHYFFYVDDEEYVHHDGKNYRARVYTIFALSDEEIESEIYWQQLYEICCGAENRYDVREEFRDSRIPENKFYRDFYHARSNLYKKQIDVKHKIAVAWFKF